MQSVMLDAAGHRRSPVTMPGYHRGRPPRNKGEQYPADPPTVEEIVAVMRAVGDRADGHRLRALDRAALARRTADQRSARAPGERSGPLPRRGARPAREGRQATRGRDGPVGVGPARAMARDPPAAPDRRAPVRDPRTDRRSALGSVRRSQTTPPRRGRSRRPAAVRAAPAAARARSRDGARGRPARRDPAPTRARQPRDHQHLPAGHRQQRRSSAPSTDDRRRRSPPPPASNCGDRRKRDRVGRPAWTDPMPHPSVAMSGCDPAGQARPGFVLSRGRRQAGLLAAGGTAIPASLGPWPPISCWGGEGRIQSAERAEPTLLV